MGALDSWSLTMTQSSPSRFPHHRLDAWHIVQDLAESAVRLTDALRPIPITQVPTDEGGEMRVRTRSSPAVRASS